MGQFCVEVGKFVKLLLAVKILAEGFCPIISVRDVILKKNYLLFGVIVKGDFSTKEFPHFDPMLNDFGTKSIFLKGDFVLCLTHFVLF